jgi:hypothetical protein
MLQGVLQRGTAHAISDLARTGSMAALKNRRRERFAVEVASMTPLARAYVEAGYRDSPWAAYNASKLAHQPEVADRINELCAELRERSQLHAEYIHQKLLPLVEANPLDLFETVPDGNGGRQERLRSIADMPRRIAQAISRIRLDPETGKVTDIAFHGKTEAAAVLLRSIAGINKTKIELTGENGGPITVEDLSKLPAEDIIQLERIMTMLLGKNDQPLHSLHEMLLEQPAEGSKAT